MGSNQPNLKQCILCGCDVSTRQRVKDPQGRYHCVECYEVAQQRRRARARQSEKPQPENRETTTPSPLTQSTTSPEDTADAELTMLTAHDLSSTAAGATAADETVADETVADEVLKLKDDADDAPISSRQFTDDDFEEAARVDVLSELVAGAMGVETRECPKCGSVLPRKERICRGCGFDFKTVEGEFEPETGVVVIRPRVGIGRVLKAMMGPGIVGVLLLAGILTLFLLGQSDEHMALFYVITSSVVGIITPLVIILVAFGVSTREGLLSLIPPYQLYFVYFISESTYLQAITAAAVFNGLLIWAGAYDMFLPVLEAFRSGSGG